MQDRKVPLKFEELIAQESNWLDEAKGRVGNQDRDIARPGPTEEPWVAFTVDDHFGVALSGGGIRSATFNLGLLQALDKRKVLEHCDYLSTVSGGGYTGGFWTVWHHRETEKALKNRQPTGHRVFPCQTKNASDDPKSLGDEREPPELRHLREFSRFLMPRVGFFHSETWGGIVTILGGMIPSLVATVALLVLGFYSWFHFNEWLVQPGDPYLAFTVIAVLTLAIHGGSEWRHYRIAKDSCSRGQGGQATAFIVVTLVALGLTLGGWYCWRTLWFANFAGAGRYLGPAAAWGLAALALLALRALTSRWWLGLGQNIVPLAGYLDSATARCLAPTVLWAGLVVLWELCARLNVADTKVQLVTGGSPIVFGALFAWLKDWLVKPNTETHASKLLNRVIETLKPLAPKLLANLAVISLIILVGVLFHRCGQEHRKWICYTASAVVFFTLISFDLARVGMHDFYRSRIARCFLGAARAGETDEFRRMTMEQAEDDVTLQELAESQMRRRPIHLICCAANGLGGDPLGNLYRGARSAVFSPSGISLGGFTKPLGRLRLSSALTASAAAFNSQMGYVSVNLGPAVAFLMSALNLRLGLWVPHPFNPYSGRHWFPGWYFFREMFGRTDCVPSSKTTGFRPNLHLSDGGHFENLGLYELIRRHCRYVIVSDCSADPEVAFDDLANALRRIREDFGVEIELDVRPLRPDGDRLSRQHAVVGTVHYDGLAGSDKGTVLYFKPSLTGDEPPDVLQYRTRNLAFPHEGTGDQFYDEAQWESYRRLGEHAGHVVLRFLEKERRKNAAFVENLFLEASQLWHPQLARQSELFLELTARFASLEAEIRDHAPSALRAEFFPELAAAGLPKDVAAKPGDSVRTVYFLMLIAQLMEDVWLDAQLDTYWSHPLNDGWMNYFQRWASMPSFRRWWPILRPIYSIGFRDFVKDRFDIRVKDDEQDASAHGAMVKLAGPHSSVDHLPGLAWEHWLQRYGAPVIEGKSAFECFLSLDNTTPPALNPIQCGFLLYQIDDAKCVRWSSLELFVPHSLIGAGINARFLDAVIDHFCSKTGFAEIHVELEEITPAKSKEAPTKTKQQGNGCVDGKYRPDPASRRARLQTINFYKSRRFEYLRTARPPANPPPQNCDSKKGGGEVRWLRLDLQTERERRKNSGNGKVDTIEAEPPRS